MKGQFIGLHGEKSKGVREAGEKPIVALQTEGRSGYTGYRRKGSRGYPFQSQLKPEFDLRQTKIGICGSHRKTRSPGSLTPGHSVSFVSQARIRGPMLKVDPKALNNGHGPEKRLRPRRRRLSLCGPGSSPGKTPDGHRAAQKALL